DLVVRNGTVVTASGMWRADLVIDEGRFVAIGTPPPTSDQEIDATGRYVLPGVIDGHVHFREPGLDYKEDWTSGSRAAVMGGVTTVLEMPNTLPPTRSADLVTQKHEIAARKAYCDFGFFGLVSHDNFEHLAPMANAGVVGYKSFLGETTGNIPAPDDGALLDTMREISRLGLRI